MAVLSESQREKVRVRLGEDTPFWGQHCCKILNPQRKLVPLVPRPWQARTVDTPAHMTPLDEALEMQRAAGLPMRAIILKARKLGFSTWTQAKVVQRLSQRPYLYGLSVAHRQKAAAVLYDMAKLMVQELPTEPELGLGFSIRPQIVNEGNTRSGAQYMVLGDKRFPTRASVYETMTAGSKGGGRASTPSDVHASEAAHWDDPEFIVGLLNAVPREPDTIVVIESTANGFNDFHGRWCRAVEGAEDPDFGGTYVPLFYGWQDNPYNATLFTSEEARMRFGRTIGESSAGGDQEEIELIERFDLSLEQLLWRRSMIREECDGKLEIFHQEHPSTPEEAFIGSGNPVFSGILISRAIAEAQEEPPPVSGVLRGEDFKERRTKTGTLLIPQKAIWLPDDQALPEDYETWQAGGSLQVWEHPINAKTEAEAQEPRPDGQYIVFGDVAQGAGTTAEDRDFSAIQVIDHVEKRQVARYVSRIDIHEFPMLLFLVATYYNMAWLAPEVQGLGIGVVDALVKDLRYPRVYRRRRAGDDRRTDQREELLGWSTDGRTKPLMEQTFAQSLKDGTHGMRDPMTARQFTTYVSDERGKHGAQKGTHDDLVISWMGARRVAFELSPRAPKGKRGRHQPADPLTGY